jgi:8-amino-7-oxononanoate synthase
MRPDSPLGRRLAARLARWRDDGLLRTLRPPAGVDLSSNDYLGLSRDPRLAQALAAAAAREGVGSTGSRLLRGEREQFDALERRFARFKAAERSLYFSSGYLANLAVLTTLTEEGDLICSDASNHASLIDGMRLSRARRVIFPHGDLGRLARLLAGEPCQGIRFVVVESLFSMDGDIAPLAAIAGICRAFDAVLVVDEAHAVGVFGDRGTGLLESIDVNGVACVSINAAGKALGVAGAFVAGPAPAIEHLVQRARPFVYSTAPPPAVAAAIEASLSIVEAEPDRRTRVRQRSAYLRRRLSDIGLPVPPGESQILPVLVGDNAKAIAVAARLASDGFDVRAIRPPSVPPGTARLRLSINEGLSEETLDRVAGAVGRAFQEAGLCSAVSS